MAFLIYMGLAINSGAVPVSDLPVIGQVMDGAPADKSGLLKGDIIKSVDGKKISSWQSLVSEIYPRPNEAIELKYLRGGRENSINLTTSFQMNLKPGFYQNKDRLISSRLKQLYLKALRIIMSDLTIQPWKLMKKLYCLLEA